MINLAATILKIKVPNVEAEIYDNLTKNELVNRIKNNKYIKTKNLNHKDQLYRELYFSTFSVEQLCEILQKWFKEHDLLQEDSNCGIQGKKKI